MATATVLKKEIKPAQATRHEEPVVRFKPEVERALRRFLRGEGHVVCKDKDEFFKNLGLR